MSNDSEETKRLLNGSAIETLQIQEPLSLWHKSHKQSLASRRLLLAIVVLCLLVLVFSAVPGGQKEPVLILHASGLVYAERSNETHPVPLLMKDAERRWERKVASQSKDLLSAVAEYKRRYRRDPPKGFDRWFGWAKRHRVVLIDEFDHLNEKIEPFFALSPRLLQKRQRQLRLLLHQVALVSVVDGELVADEHDEGGQLRSMINIMRPLEGMLEDVDVLVNLRDEPRLLVDWRARQQYLNATRHGVVLDDEEEARPWKNSRFGLESACPPDSRINRNKTAYPDPLPSEMAFLSADHAAHLDVCQNPEWVPLHSLLSHKLDHTETWCIKKRDLVIAVNDCGRRPLPYGPLLSWSPLSALADIPLPSMNWDFQESYDDFDELPFMSKPFDKAVWRGRLSGQRNVAAVPWKQSQRARLHLLANDPHNTSHAIHLEDAKGVVSMQLQNASIVNQRYLDAALRRFVTQCEDQCNQQEAWFKEVGAVEKMSHREQQKYRYMLDIDDGWSGRFKMAQLSNSAVIKSSVVSAWHRDRIQPYYHYIPSRVDYKDIYDIMSFFSGDLDGQHAHLELAERIADNGRKWALEHMRELDLQAYSLLRFPIQGFADQRAAMRLFLEMARLLCAPSYKQRNTCSCLASERPSNEDLYS